VGDIPVGYKHGFTAGFYGDLQAVRNGATRKLRVIRRSEYERGLGTQEWRTITLTPKADNGSSPPNSALSPSRSRVTPLAERTQAARPPGPRDTRCVSPDYSRVLKTQKPPRGRKRLSTPFSATQEAFAWPSLPLHPVFFFLSLLIDR
jgi:hypothetical protein